MLPLCQLISHNGAPVLAAVPPRDNYARKRVFQNAYAIETHATRTEMASNFHCNVDTGCQEVAAGHLENMVREVHCCMTGGGTREGGIGVVSIVWFLEFSKCSSNHDSKWNDLVFMTINRTKFQVKRRKSCMFSYFSQGD